jgi:histidine triad (HIT) family protein
MDSCVFCKILSKRLDASYVYKGKNYSAFLDIHPVNKGHVLVVPNTHFENFSEIPPHIVGEMFEIAQRILLAIPKSKIECQGANLFLSDGAVAGQEVPHSHLHIVPRFKGDGHRMGFSHANPGRVDHETLKSVALELSIALGAND